MTTIAILGAGLMGSAVAWPLADNGHDVRLVGTHLDHDIIASCKQSNFHPRLRRLLPTGVRPFFLEELPEASRNAEIFVSGVNSLGVHWAGRTLGPYLTPEHLVIAITKGLEVDAEGDLQILPGALRGELPAEIRDRVQLAAVGGPCIAGELAGRRQSCVVFGCRDAACVERLAATFRTPYYHIWTTTDLVGLEYSAALKNAYTLGVGLAAGLLEQEGGVDSAGAYTHNMAAAVFAQACTEIERLLELFGGTRSFAYGLPGAGDLYVTAVGGRTMRLGKLLGAGRSFAEAREIMAGETLEAAEIIKAMGRALPRLIERGALQPDELPLMHTLIKVLIGAQPVTLAFDRFFGGVGRV